MSTSFYSDYLQRSYNYLQRNNTSSYTLDSKNNTTSPFYAPYCNTVFDGMIPPNQFDIDTPFQWMNFMDPYMQMFQGMDFASIMMFQQQQQMLMGMYKNMPMQIGMPKFYEFNNFSPDEIRQGMKTMKFSGKSTEKINNISKEINCSSEDLTALIYFESGGNPKAVNKTTDATGLIQFMPSTAKWLGTSTRQLYNMPAEKQLDYVKKYLTTMKQEAGFKKNEKLDAGQLYALVFMPGKAKKGTLCSRGSIEYQQNTCLDFNGDGRVDVNDLYKTIKSTVRNIFHSKDKKNKQA